MIRAVQNQIVQLISRPKVLEKKVTRVPMRQPVVARYRLKVGFMVWAGVVGELARPEKQAILLL